MMLFLDIEKSYCCVILSIADFISIYNSIVSLKVWFCFRNTLCYFLKSVTIKIYLMKKYLHKFGNEYFSYVILLFFFFSFLFQTDLSFDQDLGMHLELGKIIWQTHTVPKTNLVSYTNPTFPFINHHWLFEVLVYLGSIHVGIEAMLVLKILILLFSLFVILLIAQKKKSVLLLPIAFIFLHLMRDRIDLRPEIFSYLFTAITYYFLEKFERTETKLIYIIPLISLLWVNTHIYFPVGLFLQAVFVGQLFFQKYIFKKRDASTLRKFKTLTTVFVISIFVTLINPNFINGALYPFTVFNNYGVTVAENQSIFVRENGDINSMDHDYLFFIMSLFIIIFSFLTNLMKEKYSFKNFALTLLGLGLACQAIKGFPYLVFISLPSVAESFNFIKTKWWTKVLNGIVVILILIEAYFYLSSMYYNLTFKPNNPTLTAIQDEQSAMDFVLKHNLTQPIFNNYGTGGYILYRSYPKYKVFVDERPEAYPASFFKNTYFPMLENYSLFKKEESKYKFQTIFFTIDDQTLGAITFLNAITKDSNWKIVYLDQYMIIFVKTNVQKQLHLSPINLSKINVNDYHYSRVVSYTNLSNFFYNVHEYTESKNFNEKALEMSPDNPPANYSMSYIMMLTNPGSSSISKYAAKTKSFVFW
jgi:hypothetical protein